MAPPLGERLNEAGVGEERVELGVAGEGTFEELQIAFGCVAGFAGTPEKSGDRVDVFGGRATPVRCGHRKGRAEATGAPCEVCRTEQHGGYKGPTPGRAGEQGQQVSTHTETVVRFAE